MGKYCSIILLLVFLLVSCSEKYSYYFSQEQYKQNGIRGYIKINDNLIYPVTSYYSNPSVHLPEDAILLARETKAISIPIDSIKKYNSSAIKWPHRSN